MTKKQKLWLKVGSVCAMPVLAISPIVSCTTSSVQRVVNEIDNPLQWTYEYVYAFREEETNNPNLKHDFWIWDEKIYEDDTFKIYVDGQEENLVYLDLFDKDVKKWYLIKINLLNSLKGRLKEEVNRTISNEIVDQFYSMVTSHFKSSAFYLPLTTENMSTKIIKNGYGTFRSSWGVWNSTTKEANVQFLVNNKLVRNQLLGQNNIDDDSVIINKVKINDLYYLPLINVIDPPVGKANWQQQQISFNDELIINDLDNVWKPIILPNGADKGQEWYKWFYDAGDFLVNLISLGLSIAATICTGDMSLALSLASISLGTTSLINGVLSKVFEYSDENYNENKYVIDNFWETLTTKGYKQILDKEIDLKKDNIINVNARAKYEAKATAFFGNRTEAAIYDVAGLATTEIEWTEYIKK